MFSFFLLLIAVILFIVFRVFYLLHRSQRLLNKKHDKIKTLIILGSGGHTAEMMAILRKLNKEIYSPRSYVLAESDHTSMAKVVEIEAEKYNVQTEQVPEYNMLKIPRSRNVGQSYVSSVWTTLWSILKCIPLVYRTKPNLILCNGPGTCVPICLIAFLLKIIFINSDCKIVFIESVCRTKSLSLSGKLLFWIVDLFVVQWPQITKKSNRIKHFGRLI